MAMCLIWIAVRTYIALQPLEKRARHRLHLEKDAARAITMSILKSFKMSTMPALTTSEEHDARVTVMPIVYISISGRVTPSMVNARALE